jgi:hypothetical protein
MDDTSRASGIVAQLDIRELTARYDPAFDDVDIDGYGDTGLPNATVEPA